MTAFASEGAAADIEGYGNLSWNFLEDYVAFVESHYVPPQRQGRVKKRMRSLSID